ncbi:MAG: glycosyltransferase family 4 protein [Bacteroidia bacterium]|nr:glycosyltransferase family 4 protein [Bacteroidia bacterium]
MSRKKILVLTPYPVGCAPSQRLKFEQYYASWEKEGYTVHTLSFVTPAFWKILYSKGNVGKKIRYTLTGYLRRVIHLFKLPAYDIVYVHLWVTPLGLPGFERAVRLLAKRLIYDIDDLIFLGHVSEANQWTLRFKGRLKALYLMRKADHVITCTPILDEFVRKYNKKTTDISSTINTEVYRPKTDHALRGTPVLGWSGSHSTSRFLHLLAPVLRELAKELDFKLLVIGDGDFQIEGVNVEAMEWPGTGEVKELARIDIGLYPLPEERWVLGKSGLKALQYMGLGIPVIASAKGANFRIITDGENGFLVKTPEEWKNRILLLLKDQSLRERLGNAGRVTVEEQFSVIANTDRYLAVLRDE